MSTVQAQIWRGATFTIERTQNPVADTVIFRFSGPFTARDMYSSLTPLALRNIFESDPPHTCAQGQHLRPHRSSLHGLLWTRPGHRSLCPLPEQRASTSSPPASPHASSSCSKPRRPTISSPSPQRSTRPPAARTPSPSDAPQELTSVSFGSSALKPKLHSATSCKLL